VTDQDNKASAKQKKKDSRRVDFGAAGLESEFYSKLTAEDTAGDCTWCFPRCFVARQSESFVLNDFCARVYR
jgi:hypothetical protein